MNFGEVRADEVEQREEEEKERLLGKIASILLLVAADD